MESDKNILINEKIQKLDGKEKILAKEAIDISIDINDIESIESLLYEKIKRIIKENDN